MKLLDLLHTPALHEEFERLRGSVHARHVLVTAAGAAQGVSSVAALLARSLAGADSVLLAEGNLRHPCLAGELQLDGPGLLDWDSLGPLPTQRLAEWPELHILTAGHGKLPSAAGLTTLLDAAARRARQQFERCVWDSPAASLYPDLQALAAHCDGALVVAEMDRARIDGLLFLRDTLQRARLPILGSVLNRSGRYWPRHAVSADAPR